MPRSDGVPRRLVLVVDDDAKTRKAISRMLDVIGFDSVQASDGTEAIHIFASRSQEIVAATLDLTMPTTNGRETLAMLSEIAPMLPIVISSGLDPHAEHLRGRVPGTPGITYLQKPYDAKALKGALEKVMGEMRVL